ncbi:MAG TPA: TetR/AcrR family transcriptional regulator [Polyangium sp.]|jgi:AcrR family transcriptional regulator|nr:TetR/AcrR family transcriptional regulator [Polyangium sp.]
MMNQGIKTPRKKPQQARSRATVDAILIAATYILERDGWSRFTTNRVAEKAGVNIASLYQYFPNKEALIEALRQVHIDETRRAFVAASFDANDAMTSVVRAVIAAHRVSPTLHRRFVEEMPRDMAGQSAECLNDPTIHEVARRMVAHMPDPELSLFMMQTALHAVIHEAACYRLDMLTNPRFEDEVVRLAKTILQPPRASQ